MTTIRRITVSQIDGNDANANDPNEIRPFGETAFYIDQDFGAQRLTLMMFDGVRTHQYSKVLSPGVLYGSNADAGDGSPVDTIKLIPDAGLFAAGSDQYIVVDPTGGEPGHIHLRAGGTQDASSADLYLGGEETCVRVSDTSGSVTIRTTNQGDPDITMNWTFDNQGNLYFPGIGNNRIGESEPGLVVSSDASVVLQSNNNIVNIYEVEFIGFIHNGFGDGPGATLTVTEIVAGTITDGMTIYGAGLPPEGWPVTIGSVPNPGSGGTGNYLLSGANFFTSSQTFNNDVLAAGSQVWIFGTNGNLTLPNNSQIRVDGGNLEVGNVTNFNVEAEGVVNIYTDTNGETPYQWQFDDNGTLRFPNGTFQTTAYTGNSSSLDITDTNGLTTTYYPVFVETRSTGQTARSDVNLTYRTDTNTLGIGSLSFSGEPLKLVSTAPSSSTGTTGDKKGNIHYGHEYFYYCIANYAEGGKEVTVQASNTTFVHINKSDYPNLETLKSGNPGTWTITDGTNTYNINSVTTSGLIADAWELQLAVNPDPDFANGSTAVINASSYTYPIWRRLQWSTLPW